MKVKCKKSFDAVQVLQVNPFVFSEEAPYIKNIISYEYDAQKDYLECEYDIAVKVGDWIIKEDIHGVVRSYTDKEFNEIYQKE